MAIYKLNNTIQHYPWGSRELIPRLLNINNEEDEPCAELWMGAHPKAPSRIPQLNTDLISHIHTDPGEVLGGYSSLPFLFKVLAADAPLSIQAHPDKRRAEEGYARENSLGIPVDSPERNYKDDNHKPEIICARTDFWALRGFRDPEEISALLSDTKSRILHALTGELAAGGLNGFMKAILEMETKRRLHLCSELKKESENRSEIHWNWVGKLLEAYPSDAGTLSPLFLNLVNLSPGEAMYLPAGELHAYLCGMGIELMANSDNVLRGGLTQKHIDVPELLDILTFQPASPEILRPRRIHSNIGIYDTPAGEFSLSVVSGEEDELPLKFPDSGVSIYINMEHPVTVSSPSGKSLHISKGESFLSEHSTESLTITETAGRNFLLYRAGVPE